MPTSREIRTAPKLSDAERLHLLVRNYQRQVGSNSLPVVMTGTAIWAGSVIMATHKDPKARMYNFRRFVKELREQMEAHAANEHTESPFTYEDIPDEQLQAARFAKPKQELILPIPGTDPADTTTIIGTEDLGKIDGFEKLDLDKED